jgi:hypothetical protein
MRLTSLELHEQFRLRVSSIDKTHQIVDLASILYGPRRSPVGDPKLVRHVRIDSDVNIPVWLAGADVDLATLCDWPRFGPLLAEPAPHRQHETIAAS